MLTVRRTTTLMISLALLALVSTGPADAEFRWDGSELILRLELPLEGSFRVDQSATSVLVSLPAEASRPDLRKTADPQHLVDRADWELRDEALLVTLQLGAGVLVSVEREAAVLTLGFQPSLFSTRSYVLGPDDVLTFDVYGEEELSGDLTVDPGGNVQVDLIGSVRAMGRTTEELAEAIRLRLGEDYLSDPKVTLEVKRYREQHITLAGPVGTPGRLPVRGPIPMSRAIALAGGFSRGAGFRIDVSRLQPDGSTRSFDVSRADLESGRIDPILQPDDLITVSAPELVYLDGEVGQSGALVLSPGLTLLKAVALAQGVTPWANESDIQIHREVGGQPVLETHNLKKIRAHKAPDPTLRPGDLVVVPRRFL